MKSAIVYTLYAKKKMLEITVAAQSFYMQKILNKEKLDINYRSQNVCYFM